MLSGKQTHAYKSGKQQSKNLHEHFLRDLSAEQPNGGMVRNAFGEGIPKETMQHDRIGTTAFDLPLAPDAFEKSDEKSAEVNRRGRTRVPGTGHLLVRHTQRAGRCIEVHFVEYRVESVVECTPLRDQRW